MWWFKTNILKVFQQKLPTKYKEGSCGSEVFDDVDDFVISPQFFLL